MAFLPPAIIEIKAIADKAIAEFGKVNDELKKIEGTSDKAGKGIDRMGQISRVATAGLLAAGTAMAGFAAYGVKAAMEMETELTKLGQSLANIGETSQKTKDQLMGSIDSMEQLGFQGEDAAAALTTLVQRTGDVTQSQKILALAADVARARNMSLAQASNMLALGTLGSARAFKQFGITLDSTLPKNQAIAKAMDELQQKVGGQAQAATQTLGVQMQILKNEIENVAETVGATIIPILTQLVQKFRTALDWAKRNKDMLLAVGKVVLVVTFALASYNATVKAVTFVQNVWNKAVLFGKSVLALFTKQQQAANAAMKANPIGLVVTAVMLLAAGFVWLWNKSEAFRKLVIEVGKAGIKAFAFMIEMVGRLATGYIKIVTGPLKLLLKGLQLLGVDAAGKALDGIEKATEGVGKFFESAADKVSSMSKQLDGLKDKKISIGLDFKAPEIPDLEGAGLGDSGIEGMAGTEKEKAAAAKAAAKKAEEIKKNNVKYMEMIRGFEKEIAAAQKKYDETKLELERDYLSKKDDLRAKAAEKEADLKSKAEDKITDLKEKAENQRLKIEADYKEKQKVINQRYNDAIGKINKKYADDMAKLAESNEKKKAEILEAGAEKMRAIVQQSMDRLRDAFKTSTEFKVGDLFKGLIESGKATAEQLLATLKEKLGAAKKLAENASMLAGMGFSQTFIEQVVSAGPEIGNQLAESLKNATPESIKELQSTFGEFESVSNTALDGLAKTMYDKNGFATKELADAYTQAQADMANALKEQQSAYQDSLDEINKAYQEALTEAAMERMTALAEAKRDYDEALLQNAKELKDAIDEVNKDLEDALAELNKDLEDALKEAEKDFNDKMAAAKKELSDTLSSIEAEYTEKFKNMTDATLATKAAVDALVASLAALRSGQANSASAAHSYATSPSTIAAGESGTIGAASIYNNNISLNQNVLTDPQSTASAIVNAIKFGSVVVPTTSSTLASGESGVIGAASIASRTYRDPSYVSMGAK